MQFQARVNDRLNSDLAGTEIWLRGTIASLPQVGRDHVRFIFRPDTRQAELARIPDQIQVAWYRNQAEPQPDERWRLKLRLRPPRGLANFQGRDSERSYFANGVGALGTVLDSQPIETAARSKSGIHTLRAGVREQIREILPAGSVRALLLSLAIADRSELKASDWQVLRATGTGHLLAISGLHIGLAAVMGFWVFRSALFLIPGMITGGYAGFSVCCAGAVIFASGYGALAGFPISTLRALGMLLVATLVLRMNTVTGVLRAWCFTFLVIMILMPFAILTAGFWLSFAAVLALILYFSPRCGSEGWLAPLPSAQVAVMALTVPLGAFWFQSGSWLSMPANLFSIPWVSLVCVPLILAAIVTIPVSWLFPILVEVAAFSCEVLLAGLSLVASMGDMVQTPAIGLFSTLLGLCGGLLFLLPAGLPVKWLGLCLLVTLVLPRASALKSGEFSLEVLDVGQGLAVEVRTRHHSLLYDTGPGDGRQWSMVDSVIAPALQSDGRGGPDLIVVSHADLDHAGGLDDTMKRFTRAGLLFNGEQDGSRPDACQIGKAWTWDNVHFEVLHPSPWLPYLGNDSSCVISIDNGRHRALLTGDIGKAVESRLATTIGQHDFMTVPHHGSTSSSSRAFLRAVKPSLAVVSASYGNRFGFPKPEVLSAYERIDAQVLSTIDCGAIRAHFPAAGNPRLEAARIDNRKLWQWRSKPADCMVRPQPAMYHLKGPKNKE